MKRAVSVLAWLVPAVVGCARGDMPAEELATPTITDSAGVQIVENASPAWDRPWTLSAVPLFEIGGADERPEYQLFRVSAARILSDGRLVVANAGTREVRWYSGAGEFIRRAGGEGQGPGEFQGMSHLIVLPDDSIAVGDVRLGRLTIFGADGGLATTISLQAAPLTVPSGRFSDGSILLTTSAYFVGTEGPERTERLWMSAYRLDPTGARVDTLATMPWLEVAVIPSTGLDGVVRFAQPARQFGRGTWVAGTATGWIVADNARSEIEFRNPEGMVTRIARFAAVARPVTAADVDADFEWEVSRRSAPNARELVQGLFEGYPPTPETMPAFGCAYFNCTSEPMLIDSEGNVWLAAYSPPAEGFTTEYFVFDSNGRWLGLVSTPPGLALLAVSRDVVVGKRFDDLGVETISVYALVR